jgi:hypothetical protein
MVGSRLLLMAHKKNRQNIRDSARYGGKEVRGAEVRGCEGAGLSFFIAVWVLIHLGNLL